MIRRRVIVGLSALGILLTTILVVAGGIAATQTAWGRAHIQRLVVAELRRVVHGQLYVGALEGNLITNLTIDSLEIRDRQGQLFLATGRVHAEFDPRDLLDRRILFQRLEVDHPYVELIHHHDDSWNFKQILSPSTAAPSAPARAQPHALRTRLPEEEARGYGDFIMANEVVIRGGTLIYSDRWHPDDSLRGARRDSAITEALHRPHFGLERTPEGLMRTLSWTGIQLIAPYVRIVDPDSAGPGFEITRLDMNEFFPPFRFSHARGHARIVHDSLWATFSHVELPGSVGHGGGKVFWGENRPLTVALHFDADTVSLADIAWVYPTLPTTGGGRGSVDIRTDIGHPQIVDYVVRGMDVRTTGSRFIGNITFEGGKPQLVIKDVAAEVAPVDFEFIKVLAGGAPFPVDWRGQWTGRVRGPGGALSRFRADTIDLTLHDAHVPDATSRLAGSGELDISRPAHTAFHDFRMTVARLDLRTPQYVLPDFPRLHGIVRGTATLDSAWDDVRFRDADITHTDGPGPPSRIMGSGRFTLGDAASSYDMTLEAEPLSFTTIARTYTGLRLRGEFTGPVSLQGTLSDLDLTAQLTGEPGVLGVDGHFDLVPPGLAGSAAFTMGHTDLQALFDDDELPQTDLSLRMDADLRGDSLAALDGPVSATLARSDVGRLHLDTARVVGRFGSTTLRIDSLSVDAPGGSLSGRGTVGLAANDRDSLTLALALDSLGGWRPYLADDSTAADPLLGTVRATGTLTGWLDSLGLVGSLQGAGLRAAGAGVRGLSAAFALAHFAKAPRGTAGMTLDGVTLDGVALDHLGLDARFLGGGRSALAFTVTMPTGPHGAAAAEIRQSHDTIAATLDTLAIYTHDNAWHLTEPALVRRDAGGLSIDQLSLRGAVSGWLTATANLPHTGPATAHIQADSVPLADLGELVESPASYGGLLAFDWTIAGTRANPTMTAESHLSDAQFGDVRLEEVHGHAEYADRRLTLHSDLLAAHDTTLHILVSLPVNLALETGVRRTLDNDSLRGNVHADSVEFGALAAMYPSLQNPKGSFAANLDIGGTLVHPTLAGDIRLSNGEAGIPRVGVRFQGLNADLHLNGDSLAVRNVSVATVDGQHRGRATLQGWFTFADLKDPRFDLIFRASDLHAMSNPRVADVTVSTVSPLQLTGRFSRSELTGAVLMDRGVIYLPDVLTQKNVVSLDDPEFFNVVDTSLFQNRLLLPEASPRLLQDLTLTNVRITLGNEVWLKSSEANVNLSTSEGPLIVTTAPTGRDSTRGLALTGSLVAERGDYRLNLGLVQRTFAVERGGTVRFTGDVDINPDLAISGLYTVRQPRTNAGNTIADLRIRVLLGGSLERPSVALSSADSVLQLSQSDLISYLITGQQSFGVGNGTDAYTVGSVFLPTIGTALGSRLSGGIFDYVNVQAGTAYAGNGSTSGFGTALSTTRIGAGKQLGRSTFVSADLGVCGLGATGAAGGSSPPPTASQIGIRLEQQLTDRFTLAASSEPGTVGLYCTTGALTRSFVDTPRQWGLDLFHTWQF
jgi:translocation and assembly module TamB